MQLIEGFQQFWKDMMHAVDSPFLFTIGWVAGLALFNALARLLELGWKWLGGKIC